MRKPKISFREGRFHTETTIDKIILGLFITIISSFGMYFILLWEVNHPSSLRITKAILGTMLAIASPLQWAIIMLAIGMMGIVQLTIRLIKEKKVKKSKDQTDQ